MGAVAARRPKGTGTLKESSPGVWRLVVDVGTDPATGRRRQKTKIYRGTRALAQRALLVLQAEHDTDSPAVTEMTVNDLLTRYMAWRASDLSPTTLEDWERVVRMILRPRLGRVQLGKVQPPLLAACWDKATADGVSLHRQRRAHVILTRALKAAVRWGWLPGGSLPASLGAPPSHPPSSHTGAPPDGQLLRALAAKIAEFGRPDLVVWLRLAMITGARRGEVLGLRWGDIDLDGEELTIAGTLIATVRTGVARKATTKTDRDRTVALDAVTVDMLRQHRQSLADQDPSLVAPGVLVLTSDGARPWYPSTASRWFARVREQVPGAEGVRLHDLRHSAATLLLAAGYSGREVADRLGHASPTMTLDVYGAALPSRQRDAATSMGRLLDQP